MNVSGRINITDVPTDFWGNPQSYSFDLGKSWSFYNFTILVGIFEGALNRTLYRNSSVENIYYDSLYPLGFNIIFSYDESEFIYLLRQDYVT